MDVMRGSNDPDFIQLPIQLTSLVTILKHCLSRRSADPTKAMSRSALVSRLIQTTQGIQLAAQVAVWNLKEGRCLHGDFQSTHNLPPDGYLASQNLPPLWIEQYPFEDPSKAVELIFLNKDVVAREELKLSKLAIFGFYVLQSGVKTTLGFLSADFHLHPQLVSLWEGLFLLDLASFDDHFQNNSLQRQAVESLMEASSFSMTQAIPIETLCKMQSMGFSSDAKQLFMKHKEKYFDTFDSTLPLARQGLAFCLSSGDLISGLEICREVLTRVTEINKGIPLLLNYFDQILGNGKLQELVLMNFSPLEERLFIDWAGNKKNDPECSLYLTLYFLRKSDVESAQKLYTLHRTVLDKSTHKDLWEEVGLAIDLLSPEGQDLTNEVVIKERKDGLSSASSEDEDNEDDEDFYTSLDMTKEWLPASLNFVLCRSSDKGSALMSAFSEPISSRNVCPLQQSEIQGDNLDDDEEVFFDVEEF
eukprot:g5940.t1